MKLANMAAVIGLALMLNACAETSSGPSTEATAAAPQQAPSMLTEISGVWRASDGTMISIVHEDRKFRLLFGQDAIPVQVGAIDEQNRTTNLRVTLPDGKPAIWTVAQIFDNQEAFTLRLTLHDGTQDQLSFVRKISTDDLNVIAAAESRIHSGSISQSVAYESPQPTEADDAAFAANASVPEEEAVARWAPSFDCAKASTGAERLICSSPELSAADVELAHAYREARSASTDRSSITRQQATWRTNVRDACSDEPCMIAAYQDRLAELQSGN